MRLLSAFQVGPRETRGEDRLPAAAHKGQHDEVLIHVIFVSVARDELEKKNFWRDSVHRRERVPQGPNQAEHFQTHPAREFPPRNDLY